MLPLEDMAGQENISVLSSFVFTLILHLLHTTVAKMFPAMVHFQELIIVG